MTTTEAAEAPAPEAQQSALAAALAGVQAELPKVAKDKRATVRSDKGNYSYNYADLADITEKIMPVLARHGLAFTTSPTLHAGGFVLRYDLLHESGESLGGWYPLPDPGRGTPQAMGSAITYARRYCLSAVTGVAADEDDDAQGAEAEHRDQRQAQRQGQRQGQRQERQGRPQERRQAPADEAPAEPDDDTQASRARRAAQMLDQVLKAATRESALNLWKVTKGSAFRDVDVSGLLSDHARGCLGVEAGEPITIQQVAARTGAFVKEHGRSVAPVREAEPAETRAEADAYGSGESYEAPAEEAG